MDGTIDGVVDGVMDGVMDGAMDGAWVCWGIAVAFDTTRTARRRTRDSVWLRRLMMVVEV